MLGIADMLRLARQRKGFTQKEAASKLGIVQPVLSRFENGVSDPDEPFLVRAAQRYDLMPTILIGLWCRCGASPEHAPKSGQSPGEAGCVVGLLMPQRCPDPLAAQ